MMSSSSKRRIPPPDVPDEADEAEVAAAADEPVAKKPRAGKGKAKSGGSTAARSGAAQTFENGVLRALVVENFMNHKHLRIDFDPHVNFIVGKNGSGKSAIVNALIAGFGHRASSTGRNTNKASSLIMHGKEYALIQIHVANGGEDPYAPDEFGDTIVAEHRLERSGGGSYKLKNGVGDKGRKSSRAEFEKLCSHLNIQANNPCALLTQEHAKKFLHHVRSPLEILRAPPPVPPPLHWLACRSLVPAAAHACRRSCLPPRVPAAARACRCTCLPPFVPACARAPTLAALPPPRRATRRTVTSSSSRRPTSTAVRWI